MSARLPIKTKTLSVQMTRGQTFTIRQTVRDCNGGRIDLTGARVFFAMRANAKIDPSVKLTSSSPAESGWRNGVEIADQTDGSVLGDYAVTLTPTDTAALEARGHDDPWIYAIHVKYDDGTQFPHIETSELDLYPETLDTPT